ncbi:response regulator [Paradesertivirga mongoliensis]|uniref:Response regulator n=1 Tax=Paradesertivirga mongoliensis TaxID=2100740 RepID=A0ABW4ZHX2_9SPHI|nr:response regulator [Pedobacter mongoliensis]
MSKVFIIDDDPIHQRIAQIMISKHQLFDEYVSFTEAGKGLKFLQDNCEMIEALPDVILLDLNMPVMDGWDFLDKFEKIRHTLIKDIRIFIVSSSVDEKDISRSQSYASVKGFISKPLTPDVIRKTI